MMTTVLLPTIVFDLDGTLVDSAPDMHAAANRMLRAAGRATIGLAETRRFIGDGIGRFVEKALSATGSAPTAQVLACAVDEFLADYRANAANLTRPYPGVPETLELLVGKGHRLGVCTNKPQSISESLLSALGLADHFACVGGGDRFGVRKPDPRHLLAVLRELDCPPEHAIMVGDNEHDAATAAGAGLRFVLVTYGYARVPADEIIAEKRCDSFVELISFLNPENHRERS